MSTNAQEISNDRGTLDKSHMTTFLSLERMAYTLYDTLGQYCDKEPPTVLRVWSPQGDFCHLIESSDLLGLSQDDILQILQSPDESRCIRF